MIDAEAATLDDSPDPRPGLSPDELLGRKDKVINVASVGNSTSLTQFAERHVDEHFAVEVHEVRRQRSPNSQSLAVLPSKVSLQKTEDGYIRLVECQTLYPIIETKPAK